MDSQVSFLAGMVGKPVSCISPVNVYQELPDLAHPHIGQRGFVVGFIQDGQTFMVFVRIEGEQDFYEVSSSDFARHFTLS